MKILMVLSHGFEDGGAENSVVLMRRELIARGHEVKIFSANDPDHELFSDYTFEPIPVASPFKALHHIFYLHAYRALRQAMRDFQPDVVHFHTLTSCTPSVLFATAGTPAVMTIHGPEEFTLELMPWYLAPSDFAGPAFDLTHLTPGGKFKYWYYRLLQRPVYRLGLRRLRTVIAPSKYMIRTTTADFAGAPLELVFNGIDLPAARPFPANPVLLFVGRLEQMKGVDHLLRAFAAVAPKLPELKLRIVGDGSQRQELEALARDLGVAGRTQFAGWVKADQVHDEYAAATAVAVPSVCPEAFGLVAVEAMAIGRPAIVTELGALPELVTPGRTGFVVPPADPTRLADAITSLFGTPKLAAQMGAAASAATKRFAVGGFIDHLVAVYTTATRAKR